MSETEALSTENKSLKKQLFSLFRKSNKDTRQLKQIEAFEFALVSAKSVSEVFYILTSNFTGLTDLEKISLLLSNHENDVQNALNEELLDNVPEDNLKIIDEKHAQKINDYITFARYQPNTHSWMIQGEALESIAILPLFRNGKKLGAFVCASSDPHCFAPDADHNFLQRLAYIISVCIENGLNKENIKNTITIDPITQIKNKRYFDERLLEEITRAQRTNNHLSCLFIDIDNFSTVNATHGRSIGDRILAQVAKHIEKLLRNHDIPARYNADKFVALLPHTNTKGAMVIAERLVQEIHQQHLIADDNLEINVSVSIGTSTFSPSPNLINPTEQGEQLIHLSEQALLRAKDQGRNRVINASLLQHSDKRLNFIDSSACA